MWFHPSYHLAGTSLLHLDMGYLLKVNTVPCSHRAAGAPAPCNSHRGARPSSPTVSLSIRKLPLASYSYTSASTQNENNTHRKLIKLTTWITALFNSMKLWAVHIGPLKMDGSRWRVLTKHGPLKKGKSKHFSILALRIPLTGWKGKKIGH